MKKLQYCLLATLISGIYAAAFAGTGFDYNANDSPTERCDNSIPLIPAPQNGKIRIAYTEKVKSSNLASAIDVATKTTATMVSHLSSQAIAGINMTSLVVFHCDPTLKSGLNKPNAYNTSEFDYISLLGPKDKCLNFQNHAKPVGSWDGVYGVAVPLGAVTRNSDNQLVCRNKADTPGLCSTTLICDADLVPSNIKHVNLSAGENILVHEFGHAVMDVGLPNGTPKEQARLKVIAAVYAHYLKSPQLCNGNTKKSYACTNEFEMWAMSTQSWFHANCRRDTNLGIATPDEIKKHLPRLYTVLEDTYGTQSEITPILPAGDPHCQLKNSAYKEKKIQHKKQPTATS